MLDRVIALLWQVKAGTVSVGSEVVCRVDYERRANVAPNHTMTHVLNFALRKVERTRYSHEENRIGKKVKIAVELQLELCTFTCWKNVLSRLIA